MTIDKIVRKNEELKDTFIKSAVEDQDKDSCSGCDVPTHNLQYASNGKPYCPRCYEEVSVMLGGKYK